MSTLGKWLFLAGLALALVVAFFFADNRLIPWGIAALGLLVGLVNVDAKEVRNFLIAGTALTVALISIQAQFYNPKWITDVVFFVKVFITHAVLAVAFLAFFRTARD